MIRSYHSVLTLVRKTLFAAGYDAFFPLTQQAKIAVKIASGLLFVWFFS